MNVGFQLYELSMTAINRKKRLLVLIYCIMSSPSTAEAGFPLWLGQIAGQS